MSSYRRRARWVTSHLVHRYQTKSRVIVEWGARETEERVYGESKEIKTCFYLNSAVLSVAASFVLLDMLMCNNYTCFLDQKAVKLRHIAVFFFLAADFHVECARIIR